MSSSDVSSAVADKSPKKLPSWLGGGVKVVSEDPIYVDSRAFIFGNCKIGAYTYFGRGDLVGSVRSIGRFCSIAPNVTIGLGEHPMHFLSTHPAFFKGAGMFPGLKDVMGVDRDSQTLSHAPEIGNDVWIGTNSVIARGVKVGNGAVIGAGAFVNRDVPDYAIVVGQPARVVKLRFADAIVERLLRLSWWDYPPDLMTGVAVDKIELALEELEERVASGVHQKASYRRRVYGS